MRKKFLVTLLILIFVSGFVSGLSVESVLEQLITELTLSFKADNPDLVFRPNVAVVPFEDKSPNARNYEVGPALTTIAESKMERSILFNLVDVKLREKMIKEINFSLSGLAETGGPEPGKIEAVDYFLTGQITEVGSDFLVSLHLVNVESGKVAYAADQKIPKDKVFEASESYTASYVSPYGIGMEFGTAPWAYLYGKTVENEGQIVEGEFNLFTLSLNYRIKKWLITWFGMEISPGGLRFKNTYENQEDYTQGDFTNFSGTLPPSSEYSYGKDRTSFYSAFAGLGYVFNITKTFNIMLGTGVSMSQLYLKQLYTLPDADGGTSTREYWIDSNDISLFTLRPKVKLQYFITPRVALYADYMFKYQFAEKGPSKYFFRNVSAGEEGPITLLYGLDPSVDPAGKNHYTDFTGHYVSMGAGFYF